MTKKSAKVKKIEEIPYQDLVGSDNPDFNVIKRNTPKRGEDPELLNQTAWTCECKLCGKQRSISGRLLHQGGYKPCTCVIAQKKIDNENAKGRVVGRGLMYAQEHDKSRFMEYLQKREEESKNSNCSRYLFDKTQKMKGKLIDEKS